MRHNAPLEIHGGGAGDRRNISRSNGFPINVLESEQSQGISYENIYRPDRAGSQPLWISDSSAPGGRRINRNAFQKAPNIALGNPGQGSLGRNALNGFGMSQLDLALRREFFVKEQRSLQLRIEAFNSLNHANFADPIRFLSSPLFGQSPSMLNLMLGTGNLSTRDWLRFSRSQSRCSVPVPSIRLSMEGD